MNRVLLFFPYISSGQVTHIPLLPKLIKNLPPVLLISEKNFHFIQLHHTTALTLAQECKQFVYLKSISTSCEFFQKDFSLSSLSTTVLFPVQFFQIPWGHWQNEKNGLTVVRVVRTAFAPPNSQR